MRSGQIAVGSILVSSLLVGGSVYYLQVYGFYETLAPQDRYQVALVDGPASLRIADFQGIDSQSSPLRYRACFSVDGAQTEFVAYPDATPLNAPAWFDCFDAAQIGEDLETGVARGVLVASNSRYGFDQVMALYRDGRAFVWPQINACGAAYFDGNPVPANCPLPPDAAAQTPSN